MSHKMLVAAVLLAGGISLIASPASAAGKKSAAKPDLAAAAVETVLRDETAGQVDRRVRLADALALQPDSAIARWQAGFVRDGLVWRSFDEPQSSQPDVQTLKGYRGRREMTAKTFADQVKLADWCRKKGLADQERSHLTAALVLAPTDEQAALFRRLGYCKVGNQWVSGEQFAEWQDGKRLDQGRRPRIADAAPYRHRQHARRIVEKGEHRRDL